MSDPSLRSYDLVDAKITAWAEQHELVLFTSSAGTAVRAAYVSSVAGDCFQIWVNFPQDGMIGLHAAWIDGPVEQVLEQDWSVPTGDLADGLEQVFQTVTKWMEP